MIIIKTITIQIFENNFLKMTITRDRLFIVLKEQRDSRTVDSRIFHNASEQIIHKRSL